MGGVCWRFASEFTKTNTHTHTHTHTLPHTHICAQLTHTHTHTHTGMSCWPSCISTKFLIANVAVRKLRSIISRLNRKCNLSVSPNTDTHTHTRTYTRTSLH